MALLLRIALSAVSLGVRAAADYEQLNGFRKVQPSIHTLLTYISNHAVSCKQFTQLRERADTPVADVVVRVVTKRNGRLSNFNGRSIGTGVHRIAQQTIRLPGGQRRLPDIGPGVILQLADGRQSFVI